MPRTSRTAALVWFVVLAGCQDCGNSDGPAPGDDLPDASGDAGSSGDNEGGLSSVCWGSAFRCDGGRAISCEADVPEVDCTAEGKTCDQALGCVECAPGARTCAAGVATYCRSDGTRTTYECDVVQGLTCSGGLCQGACDLSEVHDSYIGCDYYPTTTLNPVWSGFPFAVAVSNTSSRPAHVTVTRGDDVVTEVDVASSKLTTINLPWVAELKGGDVECEVPPAVGNTRIARAGAYRLRSDQPVTVYQFSPLEYMLDPVPAGCPVLAQCAPPETHNTEQRCLSYSNDASLLLPATALTGNYIAMSYPSQHNGAGFVAITATEDGTQVELAGRGKFAAGAGVSADGKGTVHLDRGDVLEMIAAAGEDPSGTRIRATKPVQVIGGHSCAYVPTEDVANCDHIEEMLFPEDTLGDDYIVTYPVYADLQAKTPMLMRISAIESDTRVVFEPEVHAAADLDAGELLEVYLDPSEAVNVRVSATKPVVVASYMVGQAALSTQGIVGDPALTLAVPIRQWRSDYLFTAPTTYLVNIADVIAPLGSVVRLDGARIPDALFTRVGQTDYAVARVDLSTNGSSVHRISSDREVGLTVYGYGLFTSYMYPGGADLERITIPPIL
jgi:hypothetical protein